MFKKGLKFLAVPVFALTTLSSAVLANGLINQGNIDSSKENISILNYETRESSVEVSTWSEFEEASQNSSVTEIILKNDIDLSDVSDSTYIASISNKKINGHGHSFVNRNISQDSSYLIGTATNVTFEKVSFDNVEMFIDQYIINDSSAPITESIFKSVGVYDMTFDSLDLASINGGNFKGMFINSINITITNANSFQEIPLINGLVVDSASVTSSSVTSSSTLGVFSGTFNITASSVSLDTTDAYLNKISFTNSTFDLNSTANVSLLGTAATSGFLYHFKGVVLSGVELTSTGSIEIVRGSTDMEGSLDYVASLNNEINGSSDSTGIVNSTKSASFSSTADSAIVGLSVVDTTELVFGTSTNVTYGSGQREEVVREQQVSTVGTSYNVIRSIFNETFGSSSYTIETYLDEATNKEYFDSIVLFKEKSIVVNTSKANVSGSKIGELTLDFTYYNESSNPIPYPLFSNAEMEIGSKSYETVNAKDDSSQISFDNDTKEYSMKADLKGTKKSEIESSGITFNALMTYDDTTTRAVESEQISIWIPGESIIGNLEENSVVFLNTTGLVLTIIFAIILLLLILLLIWWLWRRKKKKDALAKVGGVNSGYYRYVQNEPVEIPADPNLHDYDNQFGDYSTSSSDYDSNNYQNYDAQYDNDNYQYDAQYSDNNQYDDSYDEASYGEANSIADYEGDYSDYEEYFGEDYMDESGISYNDEEDVY